LTIKSIPVTFVKYFKKQSTLIKRDIKEMDHTGAQDELAYIKKVMQDSRQSIIDNGKYYLLWGILIGIASMVNYVVVKYTIPLSTGWVWANAVFAGWGFSIYWGWRDSKKQKSETLAGKLLGSVWIGMGITGFVLSIAGSISGTISYWSFCPLFAGLLGYGNFMAGTIHNSRMMMIMGFGWWAGAVWMFFIKSIEVLAVYSIFLLLFSILPGIILYSRWKKDLGKQTA
jgi:hypothetical protein